jgi:hypothetical protein
MCRAYPVKERIRHTSYHLPIVFGNVVTPHVFFSSDGSFDVNQTSHSAEENAQEDVPTEDVVEEIHCVLQDQETSLDLEQGQL